MTIKKSTPATPSQAAVLKVQRKSSLKMPVLDVRDIWQKYCSKKFDEKTLLISLAARLSGLSVPVAKDKSKMVDLLARAPAATKLQAADAIDALLNWVDKYQVRLRCSR